MCPAIGAGVFCMNTTYFESGASETAAYGGLADAVGVIATVVLAIIALAGLEPEVLLGVTTVVFGAALLIQAGTLLTEYAAVAFPSGAAVTAAGVDSFAGDGLAFLFMVGAGRVVLGILALIGIAPLVLTSAAL